MRRVERGGPDQQLLGLPQMRAQPGELLAADMLGARRSPYLPPDVHLAGAEDGEGEYVVGRDVDEAAQPLLDPGHLREHTDGEAAVRPVRQPVDVTPDRPPVRRGSGLPQPGGFGEGGGDLEVGRRQGG
ncbi:hypothetical protein ABZ357_32890 [Streptomyces sp. NPDC005917]|uniref:hypothetical protein n=1 Tax=unclassified Streptomyces TaxID=2593676 RepID=UPI0033F4C1C8